MSLPWPCFLEILAVQKVESREIRAVVFGCFLNLPIAMVGTYIWMLQIETHVIGDQDPFLSKLSWSNVRRW